MTTSNDNGKQTLVEEGTEFQGTIKSSCHVVVNGSIDGQIEAPSLTVTTTGTVLGTVKAKKLRSEGTLAGDIDSEDVYLAGRVQSNTMIRAKKLEVKLAPERGKLEVTFGECLIEVGEDPAVVQEPAPVEVAAAEAGDTPPAIAAGPANLSPAEDEPSWSDPPPANASPGDPGNATAAEPGAPPDNAGRRSKRNHQRDSQAPMA